MSKSRILEWAGVVTAILYTFAVGSNSGYEFIGFMLLFISAIFIGLWAYVEKHWGILFLQFFYAAGGVYGMYNWYQG